MKRFCARLLEADDCVFCKHRTEAGASGGEASVWQPTEEDRRVQDVVHVHRQRESAGENLAATKSCERATCLLTQVRCSTYPPLSLGRGRRRSQKRHHSRYRNRHDNAASNGEDIRFHHDLRHEGASRLPEGGWPLHHVQEMLGHASLEQTWTYLNVQRGGLRESMRRTDEVRSRCNSVVSEAGTGHPLVHNEQDAISKQVTVN